LFRAATVPGLTPSERSPHKIRGIPSRGPSAPLRLFTTVLEGTTRVLVSRGFTDAHALRRSCLAPPRPMGPLFTSRSPLPGRPGPRAAEPLRSDSFIRFEAYSSCESVRTDPGFPAPAAVALLAFCPSRDVLIQTSGPLDPNEPEGPNPHPRPQPPASDAADSVPPEGVPSPSTPGEPCPALRVTLVRPRRQIPAPFGTGPRRLLGDVPAPPALDPTVARPTLTHGAFKCLESGGSPRRPAASHGVSYLVADLKTLKTLPALAYGFTGRPSARLRATGLSFGLP